MKRACFSILVAGVFGLAFGNVSAAEEAETAVPEVKVNSTLSQNDFVVQKAFMLKDTERKIKLLQSAHDCAAEAKSPEDFELCNKALREGIRAHMNEQAEAAR